MHLVQQELFDIDVGLVQEQLPDHDLNIMELFIKNMIHIQAQQHNIWQRNCILLSKLILACTICKLAVLELQLKISEYFARHVLLSDTNIQLEHSDLLASIFVKDDLISSIFENLIKMTKLLVLHQFF